MLSLLKIVWIGILFRFFAGANAEGFKIPLVRQNWPREAAMHFEMANDKGPLPAFLRPKPPKPITNATVALYRYLDSQFYGVVTIEHQTFNMVFDTTWAHSWILSASCPVTVFGCWFHDKYDHKNSNTYVANGTKFSNNDPAYNISGYFSYESFVIGQMKTKKQLFIEVDKVPFYNMFTKADGAIGLGLKYGDDNPWFYNILQDNILKKALFSVYLNRDKQSNKGGSIMLGAIDKQHIHHMVVDNNTVYDDIVYAPIKPNNGPYWTFNLDRVILDIKNKSVVLCEKDCNAMPDTSVTTIVVPSAVAQKLHKLIGATSLLYGFYQVHCDTIMKLPPMIFYINNQPFPIKGKHYTQKASAFGFTMCLSAIQGAQSKDTDSMWIIGAAFLAQYYSIYDIENKQIGFVRAF